MTEQSNRVSVSQAATELGLNVATVRYWIEIGQLPIGKYVKRKNARRGTYLIYRPLLDAFMGKTG